MVELTFFTGIGVMFALCGMACMRIFPPFCVFLLLAKLLLGSNWCPSVIGQLANSLPPVFGENWFLISVVVAAVLEMIVHWNTALRNQLDDLELGDYIKPLFVVAMVGVVCRALDFGWLITSVFAGVSGYCNYSLCSLRRNIVKVVRMVDPSNSLKLQTVVGIMEESLCGLILFVLVIAPILAVIIVCLIAGFGWIVKGMLKLVEKQRSHECSSCGKLVHDSAIRCGHCRAEQPGPCHSVGLFGLATKGTIDVSNPVAMTEHDVRLLLVNRCPVCAQPLKSPTECKSCGTDVWARSVSREAYIKMIDGRMWRVAICGAVMSVIPVFGLALAIMLIERLVMSCVNSYIKGSRSSDKGTLSRIIYWTVLVIEIFFSGIPLLGPIFILPYVFAYRAKRRKFVEYSGS